MTGTPAMTDPVDRARILQLVPHQGAMCLWDAVEAWDAGSIRLRSGTHRDAAHPLRSGDRLRALHLCEYGAQAMAVHGGLRARAAGTRKSVIVALLAALRGVELHIERVDTLSGDLECEAHVLVEGEGSQQYGFRITHAGALLAEGRAAVMLRPAP